jgi:Lipoate-protein ligase B
MYNIIGKSDQKNIGIWVKNKKISAIGIKVKRWIAYHGCSININNDLSQYKKIIPCGLSNDRITSFDDLGVKNIFNLNKNIKEIFIKNLTKI